MAMIEIKLIIQEISRDYRSVKKDKVVLFNKICTELKESKKNTETRLPESKIRIVGENKK